MITNEKEFAISKKQFEMFRSAVANFDIDQVAQKIGSRKLAESELKALKSQMEDLSGQLKAYESAKKLEP